MEELLTALSIDQSLILTAPPGWGKTYRILDAIKTARRKVVFIFPLRALCDEVYLSALDQGIHCYNIRQKSDYETIMPKNSMLVVTTPEVFEPLLDDPNVIYILDEFHLFYYWGDTFREKLLEVYMQVTSFSYPSIFLTATLADELKNRLVNELERNYSDIYQIDMGNQKLKNFPNKVFYYPSYFKNYLSDDLKYSEKHGCSLVFCRYREEVKVLGQELSDMGYCVLTCVGGEAQEFIQRLNVLAKVDFIVATSVVSHGVNLPAIEKIYFLYNVENLDFYLQMVGRGGREGQAFEIHTQSSQYFSQNSLIKGFLGIFLKRFSNKVNNLIYMFYAS